MLDRYDKKGNVMPKPDKVLFYLHQNDLVYMPKNEDDEILNLPKEDLVKWLSYSENKKDFVSRIYKVVKFSKQGCCFIPNNYAKEIIMPKDLSEKELKLMEETREKISKKDLNYIEFGSYSNCSPYEKNDLFTVFMREGKKYKGEKPRKIQDYCVKIKVDWLGNLIEFNGLKL